MITAVATFTLSEAREYLSRKWPERHPFADKRRVWIGFDTDGGDASPLRRIHDGPCIVLRMTDWDPDSEMRGCPPGMTNELEPTIEHARTVVEFVNAAIADPRELVLAVHCHAGLYRSGAVAHWVSRDRGIEEHECSNRVRVCGNVEPTRNETFLRLLREAHAELRR